MNLSVEVKGLDDLIRDVKRAGGDAEKLVKASFVNSTNEIQKQTRSRAPHKTGTLQRSIMPEVNYPVAKVVVNEKYGQYIESGTGIYGQNGRRITPKSAKVLAWGKGGSMVFARSTAGMKPKPFFKPGVEASIGYIGEQFQRVIDIIMKELAGR